MHITSQLEALDGIIRDPAVLQAHIEISDKLEGEERYLPLEGYATDLLGSVALLHLATMRMELRHDDNGGQLLLRGSRVLGEDDGDRRMLASIDLTKDETTPLALKIKGFYAPAFAADQDNQYGESPIVDVVAPLVKDPVAFPGLDTNVHPLDLPATAPPQRGQEVVWNAQKTVKAVLLSNWFTPLGAGELWPPLPPTAAEFSDSPRFK